MSILPDELSYELTRCDRKSVQLRLGEDGRILVRAPRRMPERDIDTFVRTHADWIARHRAAQKPPPDAAELARLRMLAEAYLPVRLNRWARVMGLNPKALTLRDARSRFGSCTADGRIMLSVRLMRYPPDAIDYVVVHELAHIVHHDHSPAFHALVAQYLPDWKRRRALLRGEPPSPDGRKGEEQT